MSEEVGTTREQRDVRQPLCGGCRHAGLTSCRLGLVLTTTPEREILGRITFTNEWSGANDAAHGGFVAAVFDEMFGVACAAQGGWSVTASLTISYRAPVPIDVPIVGRAWQSQHEGRKRTVRGELRRADDNQLLADAHALFIDLRDAHVRRDAQRAAQRDE